ncbi:putative Ring finger protein [Melia azedarach]|uniref:Ring finger protein n=1 Tax=Melia azedarach TaxID=155640 RepID=A0ACC1XEH2_MELAZ|nr:putative Ring finger protein [Melia azedarach]
MGAFKPFRQISFWVFSIILSIFITPSFGEDDSRKIPPWNDLSPPPSSQERTNFSPFKPSIAVVVGVLTTMFSITFLLLLYAKHCKRVNDVIYSNHSGFAPSTARKNSGIDRAVIVSLPIFRFGALRGQKDGLECAVCLMRFEPTEVLRLLPKCKHAFHVECVDTWLDSHSTCPLCRYRVDPEDILLIEDVKILHENQLVLPPSENLDADSQRRNRPETEAKLNPEFRRVSGRHSSAGESATGFLQLVSQDQRERELSSCSNDLTSFRRSLDSARFIKKNESVAVGCFDRPRKDGLLLTDGLLADRKSFERRFEHRIIISAGGSSGGFHHRWSDVQPSDLLYLRSEMIISDSRRFSSGSSRPSVKRQQHQLMLMMPLHSIDGGRTSGSSVINSRSVSEITGLRRFSNSNSIINRNHRGQRAGLVSRWLAWISSRSQSLPAVRSDRSTDICSIV